MLVLESHLKICLVNQFREEFSVSEMPRKFSNTLPNRPRFLKMLYYKEGNKVKTSCPPKPTISLSFDNFR